MGAGVITIEQPNNQLKDGGAIALTQKAALSGVGICSVLTSAAGGKPTKCTLKKASKWVAGIERKKKINQVPLLNEDAKMICPICPAGIITVRKPLAPIVSLDLGCADFDTGVMLETVSNKNTTETVSAEKSNVEMQDTTTEKTVASDEKHIDENQAKEVSPEKYAVCTYEVCKNASTCPYMQASSIISTDGAAAKLRRNSSEKEKSYDSICDCLMEKYQVSWNNQAHHLISINAAYCRYPELVKLGNYFGYDINCSENCYFLPCWEKGDGYGEKTLHYKKAQAYEVMKYSGLQWHVGQHSYTIHLPENILSKYPQLKGMDSYNDRINKDVKKILSACYQRFDGICLEENYEDHRKWFIQQMNTLSFEIEECLDLFKSYPKDSFPYFVSQEALRFAYEVPHCGKVISIHRTKIKWILKRYQYTNYQKNSDIQLNLLGTKELTDTENHRGLTIKNLILFCENVSCFLIIDQTGTFRLPFQYKATSCYITDEDVSKVKSHFSAMLAEKADSDEDDYIAPKTMIIKRLKECGLF